MVTCKGLKGYDNEGYNAYCQGITDVDLAQSAYWLQRAAAAGDADAQYNFVNGGIKNATGFDHSIVIHKPAILSFYKQTSIKYLHDLIRSCNIDAIGALAGGVAADPLVYNNDPATIYKYAVIYNTLQPKSHFQFDEQKPGKQLTHSKIQELRKEAQAFLETYCR